MGFLVENEQISKFSICFSSFLKEFTGKRKRLKNLPIFVSSSFIGNVYEYSFFLSRKNLDHFSDIKRGLQFSTIVYFWNLKPTW